MKMKIIEVDKKQKQKENVRKSLLVDSYVVLAVSCRESPRVS